MEAYIDVCKRIISSCVYKRNVYDGTFVTKHPRAYFWTNELIANYLKLIDFHRKENALSVLASGDQAFNLIKNGIMDIDTFDINAFTEYFALGLKRAAILKYNYDDFLYIMNMLSSYELTLEQITDIINGLIPYMDDKFKVFWLEIINFNYKIQKESGTEMNLLYMFFFLNSRSFSTTECNDYLSCEENYNQLRSRLASANINFKCTDILQDNNPFNNQYDLILLSNILDYTNHIWPSNWNYAKLLEFEKKLEQITKSGGTIFLQYLFNFTGGGYLFQDSIVNRRNIQEEEMIPLLEHPKEGRNGIPTVILKRIK